MSRKSNPVTKHLTADDRRRYGELRGGAVQRRRAAIGRREKAGAQDAGADAASAHVPRKRDASKRRDRSGSGKKIADDSPSSHPSKPCVLEHQGVRIRAGRERAAYVGRPRCFEL